MGYEMEGANMLESEVTIEKANAHIAEVFEDLEKFEVVIFPATTLSAVPDVIEGAFVLVVRDLEGRIYSCRTTRRAVEGDNLTIRAKAKKKHLYYPMGDTPIRLQKAEIEIIGSEYPPDSATEPAGEELEE